MNRKEAVALGRAVLFERARNPDEIKKRFWAKVDRKGDADCWLWLGALRYGYGHFGLGGKGGYRVMAHRFSYQLLCGPIQDGLTIDHLCRVRNCVNPSHLEPVTHKENVLRGISPAAQQARRTACIRGHELSGENLYVTPAGKRQCRSCRSVAMKEFGRKHATANA